MRYCPYYTAFVDKKFCWYVVAILKSYEHLAFDRTLDTESNLFEFYVTPAREQEFLDLLHYFEQNYLIHDLKKCTNRLSDPTQQL